jgi:hypothetical protein
MLRTRIRRLTLLAALTLLCACGDSNTWSGDVPAPDPALFQSAVYPVLLRDCAFADCHGGEHRFFQVFGPGRTRLDPATKPHDPATAAELQRSYDRARSMLVSGDTPSDSLLLRKPLEITAGGQGHKGVDAFGRNVYKSKQEPDYQVLSQWANSPSAASSGLPTAGTGAALPAAGSSGGMP